MLNKSFRTVGLIPAFIFSAFFAGAQNNVITSLLTKLNTMADDTQKVKLYDRIASYYRFNNVDSSFIYINRGLELAKRLNYKKGASLLEGTAGAVNDNLGKIDIARQHFLASVKFAEEANYKVGLASSYCSLGVLDGKQGNFKSSTEYVLKAQNIYESIPDTDGIIECYLKLGTINDLTGNMDKAIFYNEKAIAINKGRAPTLELFYVYNNLGELYGKKGDLKKSLENFQYVLGNTDSGDEYTGVRFWASMNSGITYDQLGEHAKALDYLTKGLELARKDSMVEGQIKCLVNLAEIMSNKDMAKANGYLNEALAIAYRVGDKQLEIDVTNAMVDVYESKKDYENAFRALKQNRQISDSLFIVERAKEIADLQSTYDLEKSKAKVQRLEFINHRNQLIRNIILFVALSLCIMFFVLIFFYRKTKKLNRELLAQKNELNQQNTIKDKIFSIIGHDLKSPINSTVAMLSIWNDAEFTDAEKSEFVQSLKDQSSASLETLDKLLQWGQAQMKGVRINQIEFKTKDAIRKNLQLVRNHAERKGITVMDHTSPEAAVHADPSHFDIIIRNLLSNAVKFTRTGGEIEVSNYTDEKSGMVTFVVKDNGVGMDEETQRNIFKTNHHSTLGTANEKGTSIGLLLCKEYVLENGGRIWVKSNKGEGSTFYFSLKLAKSLSAVYSS